MTLLPEDIIKLVLAIVVGGLIGAEREYRDKSAGFRTIIFICVGATLFTIFSLRLGAGGSEARIAAQIVSGVGFLGAGAILRDGGRLMGLTTAATIWLTAALGMGIGGGEFTFSLLATGAILAVLWIFPFFERIIDRLRDARTYVVIFSAGEARSEEFEALFKEVGLRIRSRKQVRSGSEIKCWWDVMGSTAAHDLLTAKLLAHPLVKEFHV